jgi:hypothetical protein
MRTYLFALLSLAAIISTLAGCGVSTGYGQAQLAFEAQMNVNSGQEFHVSLGVRNIGGAPFREYEDFGGVMELRDAAGAEVGRAVVATLWELAPGTAAWPAAYASMLPSGAYQLTWGAGEYGSVTVDFTIVELEGRLYLGKESIQSTGNVTPEDERDYRAPQSLVDLARVNLARRLGAELEAVTGQCVEETEFPDASLGVPEPDRVYAQAITPGYTIKLAVNGQSYEYRASDERLVFVPPEAGAPQGSITIEGVQVTPGEQIAVHGQSTLPDDTCLGSELWAAGTRQSWWPGDACVLVQNGVWQMSVRLGSDGVPAELDPSAQYMLRVYQQNGPDIVSVFAFDLAGPPVP